MNSLIISDSSRPIFLPPFTCLGIRLSPLRFLGLGFVWSLGFGIWSFAHAATVTGNLTVHRGAKVIHSGVIAGDAINLGGRLYIEQNATINGKIKTKKGETRVSPLFQGGYVPPAEPEAPAKPIPRRYRDEADERKRYEI